MLLEKEQFASKAVDLQGPVQASMQDMGHFAARGQLCLVSPLLPVAQLVSAV